MAADLLIERLSPVTPTVEFSVGGVLTDLDGNACTVTLTKPDGTAGAASGTVNHPSTGKYSFNLAGQSEVTWLDVAWSGAIGGAAVTKTTRIEIVGELLFTLAAAKAWDGAAIPGAGVSDAAILSKRIEISDGFEQVCEVSFFPRFARETHHAPGYGVTMLRHSRVTKLLSIKVGGVAWSVSSFAVDSSGLLQPISGYGPSAPIPYGVGNITVEYVHGHEQVPGEITTAALRVARAQLVPSNIGDRATSITSEAGTIMLATAGRGQFQPYGIPLVDSVLFRYLEPLAA